MWDAGCMVKMIMSILIDEDIESKDDMKMLYLPMANRVLTVMKDILKLESENALEQYVFEIEMDGKPKHICFCYKRMSSGSVNINKVANDIFEEIFEGAFDGDLFYGPVFVYDMHQAKGFPRIAMEIGEEFDNIIKKIHDMVQSESAWTYGVWGHDLLPVDLPSVE